MIQGGESLPFLFLSSKSPLFPMKSILKSILVF